jgi:hypothetical protein
MTKQIYFYSDTDRYEDQIALGKTPKLKIGDTELKVVDERIKQQDTTACALPLDKKGSYYTSFGDREFHEYLEILGYERSRKEREWFYITVEDAEKELFNYKNGVVKVNKYFDPRPHQAWVNSVILSRFDGTRTVTQPLNLAPRFGKTLQALSLFKDSGLEVMIVAAHWLAANNSFVSAVNERFDITADIVVIKPEYEEFKKAISQGKRVLIDLSLHTDAEKIDPVLISALSVYKKLIIIDEADFGAWTSSSRETASQFINSGINLVCVATGTNIEKALIGSHEVEVPITVSYLDLLEAKRCKGPLFEPGGFCCDDPQSWASKLDNLVEVDCLTLDANQTFIDLHNNLSKEDRPNMVKFFSKRNGHLQREFIKRELCDEDTNQDVFGLYESEYGSIEKPAVMLFIPTTKADVDNFINLGKSIAPWCNWVALHSDEYSNRSAEDLIKKLINNSDKERTIIVSCSMGARSFSIPNIISVINCSDGGSMSSAIQKSSRCFTPGCGKKVGLIINWSFNTERSSNFETDLISSSLKKHSSDVDYAIRRVFGLVNFYRKDEYGYLSRRSISDFSEYVMSDENLQNMASSILDWDKMFANIDLDNLLKGVKTGGFSETKKEWEPILESAKSYISTESSSEKSSDPNEAKIKKFKEKILSIIKTAGNVYYLAPGSNNFKDAMMVISSDADKVKDYLSLVGIHPELILEHFYDYLPEVFMNLILTKSASSEGQYKYFGFGSCDHPTDLFDFNLIDSI